MIRRELGLAAAGADGFEHRVAWVLLGGWPSNLLLTMRRADIEAPR
jgi:hypothetical protein